jgi:hypothetical protein
MTHAEASARVQDSGSKTVTITVTNSSPVSLTLVSAILTAGHWQSPPPPVGWTMQPGGTIMPVNAADNAFSSASGTLTFNPADGGTLTMSWIWPDNQGLSAVASAYSNTLTMIYSTYNNLSNNGAVQFTVIPLT